MAGGKTIRNSANKIDALQLQSSARGGIVPYVRGVASVSPNLGWYGGFKAIPHTETQGGKGGGGGQKVETTTYTYAASLLMLVCRGPVIDFRTLWVGKKVYTGGVTPTQIVSSPTETYAVPASGAMTKTLVNAATLLCVTSVTVPDSDGLVQLLAEGRHYSVSLAGVLTVLDATLRGKTITIASQWRSGTINRTALAGVGLSFLPGNIGQAVWSGLSTYPTESIAYSGIAAAAGQDYDLGESAQVENHRFEVVAPLAYHLGSSIPDVDPALFVRELLVDQRDGASFPTEFLGDWTRWSNYCVSAGLLISPALTEQTTAADVVKMAADLTCSAISTSSGKLQIIPRADSPESGNGRTYTPNLVPVYDLDDECYTPSRTGDSPLRYRLKSNATRYNTWSLEYRNRANAYASEPADAKDAADIAERGVVANPSTIQAHWICTASAAAKAVQVMMQRSISVLAEYEVPLPPHYSLIDLCDLLTLKDTRLGLDREPVLVIGIDEDAEGNLKFICEDYPIGSASAPAYGSPEGQGYSPDYNGAPGDCDPPVVIEGPAQLAGTTGIELYIATSGSSPNWGGCQIWTSLDGTHYRQVATVYGAARYGLAAAALSAAGTSLAVDGLGAEQLLSGSAADAAQLATLCFIGGAQGEFVAYQTATLTGAGAYTLAGLVRGAYGSPSVAHPDNATFVRLDDRVGRSGPLDPSMVGQQVYIKCLSFNLYLAGLQSLADVPAYTYTVTGQPASYNPGLGGKGVQLRASSNLLQYPKAGGVNPASITFTADRKGGLLGPVTFSVVAGAGTLVGTGDTRTMAAASVTTDAITVRATISDGVATYVSDLTVVKLREGQDGAAGDAGVTGLLTNESATVAADSSGNVGSFAAAGGSFKVYFGLTDVSASCTFSVVSESGVDVSINSAGVCTVNSMSADTGTAVFRAVFGTVTLEKVFSIAKSKAGVAGSNGADAQLLTLQATAQTISLDGDGDLFPAAQTITFTLGLQNLSGTATWVATKYDAAGASLGTIALGGSGNTRTLTGTQFAPASTLRVVVTASLGGLSDSMTIVRVADGAQGLPGLQGGDAQLLALLATAQTFTFNGAGAASPAAQTISLTAALQNLPGTASFGCTLYNASGASLGGVALGGSGNTRTLSLAQFGAAAYATIVASLGGLSDSCTIVRLQDGSNGTSPVVSDLTNDTQTLPADSAGNVTSYAGAATTMKVYVGVVDDSANWAYSRTLGAGSLAATLSGNTLTLSSVDPAVEAGYVDIVATRSGYPTQTKRFAWSKARSAAGTTGVIVGSNFYAYDSKVDPINARATVTLKSDGSATRTAALGSPVTINPWFQPLSSGIGASVWVKATVQSDSTGPGINYGGTFGTWLQMNVDRSWYAEDTSVTAQVASRRIGLQFASDSAGATIVGNAIVDLDAEKTI